jgi:hypothetical protein
MDFHLFLTSADQNSLGQGAGLTEALIIPICKTMMILSISIVTAGIGFICWQQWLEYRNAKQ